MHHRTVLDKLCLSSSEYCITGGAWLSILGIRDNKDIDIILSINGQLEFDKKYTLLSDDDKSKVDEFIDRSPKHARAHVRISGSKNTDYLIQNYCVMIDGIKFVNLSIFAKYKSNRRGSKHKDDYKKMLKFLNSSYGHLGS